VRRMPTKSALKGQLAVVTGASGGIGAAISRALAQRGARLCLVGRNVEMLQAVADSTERHSSWITIHRIDLDAEDDIRRLAANIEHNHGGCDILIHSAGVISVGDIQNAPIVSMDYQYRVNVRAPYLLSQALLPGLRRRRGQIVFINSSVGLRAKAGVAQYAATKHALKAIADSLREEINADGVRVVSVYPGQTASPMQEALYQISGACYVPEKLLQPEDVAEVIICALSLPRSAELTDVEVRSMRKPGSNTPKSGG
jgi:short-subunit dehydrogenase